MDLYGLCSYSCSRLLASASHLGQMPHADSVLWWAPTCSTVLLARIIDLTWRWMETSLSDIGTLPLCASHVWFNVPAQHRKMTSPANLLGHLMVQQWRSHNTSKLLKTPDIAVICSDKRQAVQMQSDSVWVVEPQLLYLEAERKLKTAASKCKANAKQTQSKCKANAKQMESKRKANAKQMQSKCKGKLCLDQCRTETTTVLGEKLNIQRGSLRTFCERCADSRLQQECQCGSQCPIPALITSDCQGENTAVAVVHHCRRWNLCAGSWHFNIFQP